MSMDKINNISFTGISNIGVIEFEQKNKVISKSLSMVLKDDRVSADYEAFKAVLKKIKNGGFLNDSSPHILNIECTDAGIERYLSVNGKKVEENDKNLPLFEYVAKLAKRIENMPKKEMVVNESYVENEASSNLISGVVIPSFESEKPAEKDELLQFFDKNTVKKGANDVANFIQDMMIRYFE